MKTSGCKDITFFESLTTRAGACAEFYANGGCTSTIELLRSNMGANYILTAGDARTALEKMKEGKRWLSWPMAEKMLNALR